MLHFFIFFYLKASLKLKVKEFLNFSFVITRLMKFEYICGSIKVRHKELSKVQPLNSVYFSLFDSCSSRDCLELQLASNVRIIIGLDPVDCKSSCNWNPINNFLIKFCPFIMRRKQTAVPPHWTFGLTLDIFLRLRLLLKEFIQALRVVEE